MAERTGVQTVQLHRAPNIWGAQISELFTLIVISSGN